ncbi:MAG: hypothetical protein R3B70_19185 [Polyangiaceae bacterium]
MIWFAVIPDAALKDTQKEAATVVFFRPPPGANSFTHKADLKGFTDAHHHSSPSGKVSTLWMLARFLLSSRPIAALRSAGVTDTDLLDSFSDQVPPITRASGGGQPGPPEPVGATHKYISGFPVSFRPCGLEAVFNGAGAPHVLLLPLASENDGYPGAVAAGLKGLSETAILCLWNQCAFARDLPMSRVQPNLDGTSPTPQSPWVKGRKLWTAGHSAGNLSLAQASGTTAPTSIAP